MGEEEEEEEERRRERERGGSIDGQEHAHDSISDFFAGPRVPRHCSGAGRGRGRLAQ